MLGMGDGVGVDVKLELAAEAALERGFERALDNPVVTAAIGDEIGDGAIFKPWNCANCTRSSRRAIEPSSFRTSQMTPAG